jgi:hypothetical protein
MQLKIRTRRTCPSGTGVCDERCALLWGGGEGAEGSPSRLSTRSGSPCSDPAGRVGARARSVRVPRSRTSAGLNSYFRMPAGACRPAPVGWQGCASEPAAACVSPTTPTPTPTPPRAMCSALTDTTPLRIGWYTTDGYFQPAPACVRAVQEAVAALGALPNVTMVPFQPPNITEVREGLLPCALLLLRCCLSGHAPCTCSACLSLG